MTDATTQFFEALGTRSHEPLLQRAAGSVRFDVRDDDKTDHWRVIVEHGDLKVLHSAGRADATIEGDRSTFDRLFSGRMNVLAAALRGVITIEGDASLLAQFQRLLRSDKRIRQPERETPR
jgi:putative sterol carrier protein